MSIQDFVEIIRPYVTDTNIGLGVLGTVFTIFFVGLGWSSWKDRREQSRISKDLLKLKEEIDAEKYYGDLSKPVKILVSKPMSGYQRNRDIYLEINGCKVEIPEIYEFSTYERIPYEGESWRVELVGTKINFLERVDVPVVAKGVDSPKPVKTMEDVTTAFANAIDAQRDGYNYTSITTIKSPPLESYPMSEFPKVTGYYWIRRSANKEYVPGYYNNDNWYISRFHDKCHIDAVTYFDRYAPLTKPEIIDTKNQTV